MQDINGRAGWQGIGGGRELLRLAWPLILSNSFWTLQIALDRILLSRASGAAVGAAMAAACLFWTPLVFLQNTASYATTFVAQYTGAGEPRRVGAAVWQALYFSLAAGVGFIGLLPFTDLAIALGGHSPQLQEMEVTYFRCLCFAALPILITAAASSFFAGKGQTGTVLLINAVGLLVNALLAYAWIFGHWGFPIWGIAGAGWATVLGSATSAVVALALMLRPAYRAVYGTASGWRFDPALFRRLMVFGLPNGLVAGLDCLAFTVFLFLIGRLGDTELSASSIAFTLNLIAFLPTLGLGQAVAVLVGQRLGENQPALAERTTWNGLWIASLYMGLVAIAYLVFPDALAFLFRSEEDAGAWAQVAAEVPLLLRFVAAYCFFDAMNLVFSFALRGAGDTRFVAGAAFVLSWPIMVVPAWASWHFGWGLYWAWTFASAYVFALAVVFLLRFQQRKWQTMRVIEAPVAAEGCQRGYTSSSLSRQGNDTGYGEFFYFP